VWHTCRTAFVALSTELRAPLVAEVNFRSRADADM